MTSMLENVRRLRAIDRKSYARISQLTGLSVSAVGRMVRSNSIKGPEGHEVLKRSWTDEEIEFLKAKRRTKSSISYMASQIGCSRDTVAAKLREMGLLSFDGSCGKPDPHDLAQRLRAIPRDTRDFTARFCGDPLPGRSALDRMEGQQR